MKTFTQSPIAMWAKQNMRHLALLVLLMVRVGTSGLSYAAEKEVYTAFDSKTGVLTYYYDDKRETCAAEGKIVEVYDPVNNPDADRFEDYHARVKKAVIDASMKDAELTSMRRMFYDGFGGLSNMTQIDGMENLNTANVTKMSQMFKYCGALTSLDLSSFNTANVTDMSDMFENCKALTSLDLSKFNTANVTDMSQMFRDCKALTSLVDSNSKCKVS